MSALEQFTPSAADRRRTPRLQLNAVVPVRIGRGEGTLADISARGARVRHRMAVGRGTVIRLTFAWQQQNFAASAEVLSSRIVALGGPTYESRLHFTVVPHESEKVLRHVLASVENEELRRAVDNMHGWNVQSGKQNAPITAGFIRCRLIGSRWQKKWTSDPAQPDDGFTVPASLSEIEVAHTCRSYERIDADGRALIRMIAQTILEDR